MKEVTLYSSPQGDGNFTPSTDSDARSAVTLYSSPQGDGNAQYGWNRRARPGRYALLFPARGWKREYIEEKATAYVRLRFTLPRKGMET